MNVTRKWLSVVQTVAGRPVKILRRLALGAGPAGGRGRSRRGPGGVPGESGSATVQGAGRLHPTAIPMDRLAGNCEAPLQASKLQAFKPFSLHVPVAPFGGRVLK